MSPVSSPAVQIVDIPLAKILPHPQNPRGPVPPEAAQAMAESLKEAGQKTEIRVRLLSPEEREQHPGFEYLLIGGHVRLAGAQLAGFSTLRAVVVEPKDPNEEALDALLDNRWEEMSWWQWDLAIEARLKGDPDLSQRQLAAKLGFSKSKVNNAWVVTQGLNPASRDLVTQSVQRLDTQNKGFLITESILLALADLGTPEEVEKGLRRVLDDHMTEAQVRQMVNPTPKTPKPTQANQSAKAAPAQVAPAPVPEQRATPAPSDGLKELAMSGAAGALGGFLAANFKRALGTLVRRYMLHALAALGVAVILGYHGFSNLFEPKVGSVKPPVPLPTPAMPNQGADGNRGTQGGSVQPARHVSAKKEPGHKPSSVTVTSSEAPKATGGLPTWTPEGLPLVKDFANRFYNRSYQTWEADQDYLKAHMIAGYGPVFQKQYYPPAQKAELRDKQEVQAFSDAQPPVVVGGQGNSAQYRVQGQITLQNRSGRVSKNVWTKPVALEISVRHEEGIGCWVEKVTEVTPAPVQKAENSADPLKAVQDAAGAVSNVADGVAKVDGVKKILGL